MVSRTRTDWLKELQLVIGVITAIVAGVAAFRAAAAVHGMITGTRSYLPVTVAVPVRTETTDLARTGPGLNDRARLAESGSVDIVIDAPSTGDHALYVLTWLPTTAVAVAVGAMLFVLLRRARREDPFTAWTVRWLRIMAVVTLIGGALASFAGFGAGFLLSSAVVKDGAAGTMSFPWAWALGGIVVFAIADVTARGQRMREDLDGVI